jgi:hypothetical protein
MKMSRSGGIVDHNVGLREVSELQPPTGLLFIPQMIYGMESHDKMILTGENQRTRRKSCPSATFSTTNPTWIDTGANPGLRGEIRWY